MSAHLTDAVALHSGEYVERFNRRSLTRVQNLANRMEISDTEDVADFGCGNGMLLQALGSRTGRYIGVDFSQDFIAAAEAWAQRSRLGNYEFHCTLVDEYCSAHPASCDVATALDFAEHIADDQAVQLFASIRKAMRPQARLYVHTPNRDFFMERLKNAGVLRQFPEHIAVRSGVDMVRLLERAGFDAERIFVSHIAHYNVLKALHPLRHLPVIGHLFEARLWIEVRR